MNIKVLIKSFVNINYIKKYKLLMILLIKSCKLRLIDDKLISNIIYIIQFQFILRDHIKEL